MDLTPNTTAIAKATRFKNQLLQWAQGGGNVVEDLASGVLGFIPNGIEFVYDAIFKRVPLKFIFGLPGIEGILKLCLGITLSQFLITQLTLYVFRPLGWIIGGIAGVLLAYFGEPPKFKQPIQHWCLQYAGQTLMGTFLSGLLLSLYIFFEPQLCFSIAILQHYSWILVLGASIGLVYQSMLLIALDTFARANAASARANAKRASQLGLTLKKSAKIQAENIVEKHSHAIILQMHDVQPKQSIQNFMTQYMQVLVKRINAKLDRHFNYLTDRAMNGDLNALKKLSQFNQQQKVEPNYIKKLVERMIKPKDLFLLNDQVDSLFDKWKYQFLLKKVI